MTTTPGLPGQKGERHEEKYIRRTVSALLTVVMIASFTLAAVGGFPEDVWDVIGRMTIGRHEFK